MSTLCIAFNGTRENGQFLGDQLVSIKTAYLFAQNAPEGTDKFLLAMSPSNEMHFLWQKFIDTYNVDIVYDTFHPGNMEQRFEAWTSWFETREIEGRKFDHYRELYRRIDGADRQNILCGGENGLRRKNIFEYWYYGQENFKLGCADEPIKNADSFDDTLIYHPTYPADRGVYIAPHAKCQGNHVFTFDFWSRVVHKLIDSGITVTVGYNGNFCEEFSGHPLYRKHWGDFKQLIEEVCRHKIISCGNTGVGWVAAACGMPLLSMEPPNSNMPDYRYGICGLKSLIELVDTPDADYVARRLIEEVNRVVVLTTGCYDVLHAGHVRHLERSRALGTKLIVAMNSDVSVKRIKGEIDGVHRPVNPQQQRKEVLQAIRYVDEVRMFDGDNALDLIREIKPDVLTNGFGYTVDKIVGKELVEQYGGRAIVTCHGDAKSEPSSTKIIARVMRQSDILKAVTDAGAVSPNPFGKLKLLADQFVSVLGLPGDVADVGAYRGGCSLILRRLGPEKELHVFDTWTGTPFDDELCHHKKGEWKADIEECKALVGENDRTHYWKGVFPYVMGDNDDDIKQRMFSFVVIDPDTYQSVRDAIEFFWPRMVQGGKLFFDDYAWEPCAGVKKAVDEAFPESERVVYPANNTCVVVKK